MLVVTNLIFSFFDFSDSLDVTFTNFKLAKIYIFGILLCSAYCECISSVQNIYLNKIKRQTVTDLLSYYEVTNIVSPLILKKSR